MRGLIAILHLSGDFAIDGKRDFLVFGDDGVVIPRVHIHPSHHGVALGGTLFVFLPFFCIFFRM